MPNPQVDVSSVVAEGVVLMTWTAATDAGRVDDGVDTLIVSGNSIRVQTIHYTLGPRPGTDHARERWAQGFRLLLGGGQQDH